MGVCISEDLAIGVCDRKYKMAVRETTEMLISLSYKGSPKVWSRGGRHFSVGIYIPSLLLFYQLQHVAPMWWDNMAARGPIRTKKEVVAAAGAALSL